MQTVAEDITIDGRLVVLVRPAEPGTWPGVVMLHEIFGLDGNVRRQAERLAAVGYTVLVPDLLGEGLKITCIRAVFRSLTARTGRPFEVIEACRQDLLARADSNGRAGVIGFCMGGGFALLLAARGFDASSVNYGMIPEDLDAVLSGACPIVASYGQRDAGLIKDVPRLRSGLETNDIEHDLKVYPTAGHAFLDDEMPGPLIARPLLRVAHMGPDPASTPDAWQRIETFFAAHLH